MSTGVIVETACGSVTCDATPDGHILRVSGDNLKWHRGRFQVRALWDMRREELVGPFSVRPRDWHRRRPCLQRASDRATQAITDRLYQGLMAMTVEQRKAAEELLRSYA